MIDATVKRLAITKICLSIHVKLWIFLIAALLCGMTCLWGAGLQIDFASTLNFLEPIILCLLLAWMFRALDRACPETCIIRPVTLRLEDFLFSAAQMMALFAISALSIFLAANAGAKFSLRDDSLQAFDALLGFNWHVVSNWLTGHPALDTFLLNFYNVFDIEVLFVSVFGSVVYPGQRNTEFIALFLTSIGIGSLLFTFVPAMGMFGKADVETLNRLLVIRSGGSVMDYNRTASIVCFPSYHTILSILFPYSVRHQWWSLVPALLVNIIMLAAASPEGGHYLADILAGAGVAVMSILVVRRCLPCSRVEQDRTGRTAQPERYAKIVGADPSPLR